MVRFLVTTIIGFTAIVLLNHCVSAKVQLRDYITENVIVLVVDGPRYSETWGDISHSAIPRMDSILAKEGIICDRFYNQGETYTTAGHTAITTGFYQSINNSGAENPSHVSFFQLLLKEKKWSSDAIWLVTSKDKLARLANTKDPDWKDQFLPSMNCGVNGLGSGYRDDSTTFTVITDVLQNHHPKVLFVNFREPDFSGHQANWSNYLKGIKDTDEYVYQIWQLIQNDPIYAGKTSLFVTNDHGRHLDGVNDGFPSHGDACDGCRHINFYAFGPDFKKDVILSEAYSLIDLNATILELLNVRNRSTSGKVMVELFN